MKKTFWIIFLVLVGASLLVTTGNSCNDVPTPGRMMDMCAKGRGFPLPYFSACYGYADLKCDGFNWSSLINIAGAAGIGWIVAKLLHKKSTTIQNTQGGFATLHIIAVVVALGVAGYFCLNWYQSHKTFGPGLPPQVKLISPNGGEWKIGEIKTVKWRLGSSVQKIYVLGIYLEEGPTPGFLMLLNSHPSEASVKISENIIQGDVAREMQPGNYKLKLILYEQKPCLGLCPPGDRTRILSQDSSDGFIKVTN